ncbi:TRAF-like superfamily protein [Forsythia ovata]|uniref:TRAF-like superfamily protein n=1 Tax=Forsythia ovata TaxID=205694 RepID=A0ABD1PID3_9LAMI
MAGVLTEESAVRSSLEGVSSEQQQCQSLEALVEWRSSEQVENGTPSTSPPYWDSDDDGSGSKPSELYGKHTWKIHKFSQINKRELRSDAFEVGGYKWYILIYPQGCDVCNHLSLFLCVADHDKLLPGWSHFAQFTIAVVNKDPKKSKYSDTLHRFWKKEHDWGWKKFMELSKVLDGFIDADTLIIKAQVQVIRERADRPFRCLDCQYRRELVRVYLMNVEQICRRFVEERQGKLGKLIADKARWSSFRAFWLVMDQSTRRRMSRERTDSVLKVVVKQFFVEKEVTSTLVMDSLYSGLKALEGQMKGKKGKGKYLEGEELPVPIVRVEKDMFVLVDDVLLLLVRAAMEPLPPKDEKGPQNRTKDGGAGEEFNKDSIEHDERRLTELGRRTIEIFVLADIFSSKIEVAYQEAVALKRQEELIREEEAAWLAESEQKSKRGAADKDKRSKKKQGKQKRNNRRAKDKGRDDRPDTFLQDKVEQDSLNGEKNDYSTAEPELVLEKPNALEDVFDVSDSVDCVPEILPPDSEDRDASPVNWDTDTSEVHASTEVGSSGISGFLQNGTGGRSPSVLDDSSSTCSTDSLPSLVLNETYKGNPPNHKNQKSPSSGRNHQRKVTSHSVDWANETPSPSEAVSDAGQPYDSSRSSKTSISMPQTAVQSFNYRVNQLERHVVKEEVVSLRRNLSAKDVVHVEVCSVEQTGVVMSSPGSPPSTSPPNSESKINAASVPVVVKKSSLDNAKPDRSVPLVNPVKKTASSKPDAQKVPKPAEKSSGQQVPASTEKPSTQQVPVINGKSSTLQMHVRSKSSSAPLVPGPQPTVSMLQTAPLLANSASTAGRLGPEPTSAESYVQQSYRNAMMGGPFTGSAPAYTQHHCPSSLVSSSHSYLQATAPTSAQLFSTQGSDRMDTNSMKPNFPFGMVNQNALPNGHMWMEHPQIDSSRNISGTRSSLVNDSRNFDFYRPVHSRSQDHFPSEFTACTSGRRSHGALADDFPHLDIINDLLDDEQGFGKVPRENSGYQSFSNGPNHLRRQFSFPSEIGMSSGLVPSTSSCRLERTRSYHDDGLQIAYGASGIPFDRPRDMIPQASPRPHVNGQIDGLMPNQWPLSGSDMSFMNIPNTDIDGYPYNIPEYPELACSVNGKNLSFLLNSFKAQRLVIVLETRKLAFEPSWSTLASPWALAQWNRRWA